MGNERNTAVLLPERFQTPSLRLRARSGALNAMRRMMMPFLGTFRKVELRGLGHELRARDALVANRVVGFAEIGPDLHLGAEKGRESGNGGLDGAGHGGDDDEVGEGEDVDLLGRIESCGRQGRVAVGVGAVDVVEGLAVADDVD